VAKVLCKNNESLNSDASFENWAKHWLDAVSMTHSPSTVRGYRGRIKLYLVPYFAEMKLAEINNNHVSVWIEKISYENRNLVAVKQAHGVLKNIFQSAVENRILISNPVKGTFVPRTPSTPVESISGTQLNLLADKCREHRLLILLAGITGLKWGELIALRSKDVSILNRNLHVNYTFIEGKESKKSLKVLKNHQKRVISFPKHLQNDLESILRFRLDEDFIFASPTGATLDYNNFMKRVFRPALAELDLVGISFRSLRHTTALLLVSEGTPITVLSKILGHSSLQFTVDKYGYLYRTNSEEFLENIGKSLKFAELSSDNFMKVAHSDV